MSIEEDGLLAEQAGYYRARAGEYDRDYDRRADLRALLTTVDELPIAGDVLELACGTGQWTPRLAARARSVTAVDASSETLEVARRRAVSSTVEFVQADVFEWRPGRRYDTVFFGFWLSHVPPGRMADFWRRVAGMLAPGAGWCSSTTVRPRPRRRSSCSIRQHLRRCARWTTAAGSGS